MIHAQVAQLARAQATAGVVMTAAPTGHFSYTSATHITLNGNLFTRCTTYTEALSVLTCLLDAPVNRGCAAQAHLRIADAVKCKVLGISSASVCKTHEAC